MKNSLYDSFIESLESNNKTLSDVLFISSHQEDDEDNVFEISIEDFCRYAKKMKATYASLNINVVGKDFWLTTDTESGFFEFKTMPQRPSSVINVAKQLLLNSEEYNVFELLGLKAEYEQW
jgi:hypothetical protein